MTPIERMTARGVVLTSPSDAAAFFPDLFQSRDGEGGCYAAAQWVLRGISECRPYKGTIHRGDTHKSLRVPGSRSPISGTSPYELHEARYRPAGRGQQTRRAWVAEWRADTVRDDLEDVLGPLALGRPLITGNPRRHPRSSSAPSFAGKARSSPPSTSPQRLLRRRRLLSPCLLRATSSCCARDWLRAPPSRRSSRSPRCPRTSSPAPKRKPGRRLHDPPSDSSSTISARSSRKAWPASLSGRSSSKS